MDLIIRRAALAHSRDLVDIGIEGDRFAAIEPQLAASGAREIDAAGRLVSAPFVDAHFHMDATLCYGLPRVNESGTLLEGIALWGELKPQLDAGSAGRARAAVLRLGGRARPARDPHPRRCVRSASARGRSAAGSEAAREAVSRPATRRVSAGRRFAQHGRFREPEAGISTGRRCGRRHSAFRTHDGGGRRIRAILCEFAAEKGLRVDMHCDESDDPMSRHIETLGGRDAAARAAGTRHRLALTSMHSMDNYYVSKLMPLMREAGVRRSRTR